MKLITGAKQCKIKEEKGGPVMVFQLEWISFLNMVIVLMLVISLVRGAKRGLLVGLISLLRVVIALIAAMLLSGPLAEVFPLINYASGSIESIISGILSVRASQPLWFIAVFVVVLLITKVIEPLIKMLGEISVLSSLNALGGILLGFITGAFNIILVMLLFTTPVFSNGQEVIEASYLRYAYQSLEVIDSFAQPLTNNVILQKYAAGVPLTAEENAIVEGWLNEKGLGHDQIVDFLEGIKNNE